MSIGFEAILKYFWKIFKISGTFLYVPALSCYRDIHRTKIEG